MENKEIIWLMIENISAVIIVKNGGKTIEKTLNSIKKFNEVIVYDNRSTDNTLAIIKNYPYSDISDFLQKTDNYSTLYAKQYQGKKISSPFIATYKASFHFMKLYILKLGFLDSYADLLISISRANGVFFKYLKLYELNKK